MHTFVYQIEQSVREHFEQISLYTKSFYTEIFFILLLMPKCRRFSVISLGCGLYSQLILNIVNKLREIFLEFLDFLF